MLLFVSSWLFKETRHTYNYSTLCVDESNEETFNNRAFLCALINVDGFLENPLHLWSLRLSFKRLLTLFFLLGNRFYFY